MLSLSLELNNHLGGMLQGREKRHVAFLTRMPLGFLVTLQFGSVFKQLPREEYLSTTNIEPQGRRKKSATHV